MLARSSILATLLGASSLLTVPSISAQGGQSAQSVQQERSVGALTRELQQYAELRGVKIEDIKISQRVGLESGISSTSCTATATISIPGGTGIELSATAPTCTEAINMLRDAIAEYLEP